VSTIRGMGGDGGNGNLMLVSGALHFGRKRWIGMEKHERESPIQKCGAP